MRGASDTCRTIDCRNRQWSIDGKALSGRLVGNSLPKIPEAYVSFWFAFSQFYPNLHLWLP